MINVIKVKLLSKGAKLPEIATEDDAGADLYVTGVEKSLFKVTYKFGIAIQAPKGYYGKIVPRSSVRKTYQWMSNSVGIIDNGYRGELQATFYKIPLLSKLYKVGERAAQLIIRPQMQVIYSVKRELSDTQRGKGGFGSTGK